MQAVVDALRVADLCRDGQEDCGQAHGPCPERKWGIKHGMDESFHWFARRAMTIGPPASNDDVNDTKLIRVAFAPVVSYAAGIHK